MKHREPADRSATAETPLADEDFLHRWSRRKAAARQTPAPGEAAADAATPTPGGAVPDDPPAAQAPAPSDADMPPVESLDAHSDVSGFFSPGVSEELRRLALRRIFSLPAYNLRDGLNDYDEDYTYFAPLGDTVTADMRHQLELRAERERAERERAAHEAAAQPESPEEAVAQGETDEPGPAAPAPDDDAAAGARDDDDTRSTATTTPHPRGAPAGDPDAV